MEGSKIIVALDYADPVRAQTLVQQLTPAMCRLKIGKELFTRGGPDFVRDLVAQGYDVFLDLKFHDIPNTVARACEAAAELGVWMMNVHALGGRKMMQAAQEALRNTSGKRPRLIAVTILTSMSDDDLGLIGLSGSASDNVSRLAALAQQADLDGVVCSPREAAMLRQQTGDDFLLVTPGVRPVGASMDDQHRVLTPEQAIAQGSSYLVMGRPITQADDPLARLQEINHSLE
ncbi:MAG: orotidine-5'-phosphate decarboxylase [Gammaproteobacteria bacterium]|nr:orotidine-5'-phosphate decarboxylase [Gammaproteobacteria bacterium]